MLVGVDAAVVLLQLQMVATVCSDGVYDIRWTGWDGYKLVMDAIYHGDFTVGTALKEGLPLKLVKKQGDAVSAAVVCGHKSGSSSLNHLELCGQFFSVGVPDSGRIL